MQTPPEYVNVPPFGIQNDMLLKASPFYSQIYWKVSECTVGQAMSAGPAGTARIARTAGAGVTTGAAGTARDCGAHPGALQGV